MNSERLIAELEDLVEVQALPLMVDCRGGAGAGGAAGGATHDAPVHANGAATTPNLDSHHNQTGASGDMGHGMTPPAPTARASTPATTTLSTYTGGMAMGGSGTAAGGQASAGGFPTQVSGVGVGMNVGCAPYVCGVKSVVWCAPHSPPPHAPHAPPPPPPPVNPCVYKSVQPNGADLPIHDIPTLRYYFNLGVECMWAMYGPPPHPPPPALPPPHAHQHPHPHAAPHRHYSPRDMQQDMQQMSIHERGTNHSGGDAHKHKPGGGGGGGGDKPNNGNGQGKNNGQRPLLGPRFNKRGNNAEGGPPHAQGKPHGNSLPAKGGNNRRNSHTENRNSQPHQYGGAGAGAAGGQGAEPECVLEQPLLTLPYIPYPPPLYPIPYYPVDSDPAMMGMMSGMGYVGYEEGMEYGAPLQHYYGAAPAQPQPYPPPHHHPHHQPHPHQHHPHHPHEHK